MKELTYSTLLLLLTLSTNGQGILSVDTIKINDVLIEQKKPDSRNSFYQLSIGKEALLSNLGQSLSELLSENTTLNLKNYGLGGVSTISLRGMGAQHTTVLWEGININNPMLGQSDFSLIPIFFIDDINVYYGGNPNTFGNKASGGSIEMKTLPRWLTGLKLRSFSEYSSISKWMEGLDFAFGTGNVEYRVRGYLDKSKNNYSYIDKSNKEIERSDSETSSYGVLQELFIKNKKSIYSARIWYTNYDKNLPGSILYPNPKDNEKQSDKSIKTVLGFKNYYEKYFVEFKSGIISDNQHYINKMTETNAIHKPFTADNSLALSYNNETNTSFIVGVKAVNSTVSSSNYTDKAKRNLYSLNASLRRTLSSKLEIMPAISKLFVDGDALPFSLSIGFDLKPFEKKNLHILGNIGKSNHIPTLNDLFWVGRGNENLVSEQALNMELSAKYIKNFNTSNLKTNVTIFKSDIDNMISWRDQGNSFWKPVNISEVTSSGLEYELNIAQELSAFSRIKLSGLYTYTKVNMDKLKIADQHTSAQLIYVPKHASTITLAYEYKKVMLKLISNYTSKRFINDSNSEYLPKYFIHNIAFNYPFSFWQTTLNINLSINNLSAVRYQTYNGYPMPGRSLRVSLSINYN